MFRAPHAQRLLTRPLTRHLPVARPNFTLKNLHQTAPRPLRSFKLPFLTTSTSTSSSSSSSSSSPPVPQSSSPRPPIPTNPFKAKRPWPPDVESLSTRDQYRLEKRYQRRALLKWERPVWNKCVDVFKWTFVIVTAIWCLFFQDWQNEFDILIPFRIYCRWYWNDFKNEFWQTQEAGPWVAEARRKQRELDEQALYNWKLRVGQINPELEERERIEKEKEDEKKKRLREMGRR